MNTNNTNTQLMNNNQSVNDICTDTDPNNHRQIFMANGDWWCPACGVAYTGYGTGGMDYLSKGKKVPVNTARGWERQRVCRTCCDAQAALGKTIFPDDTTWIPMPPEAPAVQAEPVPVREILGLEPTVTVQERVEAIEPPVEAVEPPVEAVEPPVEPPVVVVADDVQEVVLADVAAPDAQNPTAILMTPEAITAMINAEIDARIAAGTLPGAWRLPGSRAAREPRAPRAPREPRAPRAAGPGRRGQSVDRTPFYENCPVHQEVQHKFKGITATALYVGPGNKFHYRSPDGDYDKEAGISAFPVAHIEYLIRAGLITTGSLSWNGWDCCNLPDRRKGDFTLDHLQATG